MSATFEDTLRTIVREVVREEFRAHGLGSQPAAAHASTDTPAFVTTKQAAQIAGVHVATIRDWVQRGLLHDHRAGRLLRVERAELIAMMASAQSNSSAPINLDERAEEILAKPRRSRVRTK